MASKTLTGRVFVILNPSSGRAVPDELERVLNQYLKSSVEEFETHWSTPGDDLAAVARAACDRGFDIVVAAGGDGTVSMVANGLVGTDARLGIIPLGTANVVAHEMGIPIATDAACRLLAEANSTATIDGMRVGDKHYFTQIGVGIDAMMIRDTPPESKRRFGNVAYLWNAAKHLLGFQPLRFSIAVDGRSIRPRAAQVMVANCGALGNSGLRWGPNVRCDDGRIDICIIRVRAFWHYLGVAWSIVRGRHTSTQSLKYLTARSVVALRTARPLPVQADGEVIGETPIEVRVMPRVLRIVVPCS